MSRTTSIAVVLVVAVVAFGGAFLVFSGDDSATTGGAGDVGEDNLCGPGSFEPLDGSPYEVNVASEPNPPTPRGTTFEILVDRDGQPVSGATVCMSLDMTEMSHEASGGQAEETEPGRYEVGVDFGMRGTWEGTVFVTEPGQTPVAAPVTLDVQ